MKMLRYSLQWRESGGDYVCVGSLGPGTAVRPKDMRFSVHADGRRLCSFRLSVGCSSRCPLSSGGSSATLILILCKDRRENMCPILSALIPLAPKQRVLSLLTIQYQPNLFLQAFQLRCTDRSEIVTPFRKWIAA